MTTRILPEAEWAKLAGTELGAAWAQLPHTAHVVVVEQDGEVIGSHVLLPIWHVEGLWIAEAHRGRAGVARRLWAGVQREARRIGARAIATASIDARVCGLLEHVGATVLPGTHYVIPVKG